MEQNFAYRMNGIKGSAIREMFKLMAQPDMISFAGGNPSPDTFPADALKDISAKLLSENPSACLQYGITEGYAPLKEKIKGRLIGQGTAKGNDEIIITTGGQQAIDLCAKVLLNPNDGVICEAPSFIGALNCFRSYEAKLYGVPLCDDGIDIEKLEETIKENDNIKILYIIPTFQNPKGVTTSFEKRKKVLEICKKNNIVIIEDNPYGELRFKGEDIPTIKSLDTEGKTVMYCGSLSKVLSPGLRIGFGVGNAELLGKMAVLKQVNDVHTNIFSQMLADKWLEEYDFDSHIEMCKNIYKNKCELMLSEMDKYFPDFVTYTRPEGGLFIWVDIDRDVDTKEFVKKAIEKKVAFVPGYTFMTDMEEKTSSFRLNYSTMSDDKIVEGIRILGELLNTLK